MAPLDQVHTGDVIPWAARERNKSRPGLNTTGVKSASRINRPITRVEPWCRGPKLRAKGPTARTRMSSGKGYRARYHPESNRSMGPPETGNAPVSEPEAKGPPDLNYVDQNLAFAQSRHIRQRSALLCQTKRFK